MSIFDESLRSHGRSASSSVAGVDADGAPIVELGEEVGTVVLREWTAQDFSLAYVRLKPHLEKHASRFLRDPFQVEEVVQDAFLYLMTALPELDSEVGVLRFLKWKIKMLAIDVSRINSKYLVTPLEEQDAFPNATNGDELSLELERADDSAVVSLALAKLSPRQRQVIVETQLLEKPLETVARDMGVSNNALRQLLYRARAAFKVALVGEADISGLPASAMLSLAAKKAARESGKVVAGASALFVAMFVIISVASNPVAFSTIENVSMPISERSPVAPTNNPLGTGESKAGIEEAPPSSRAPASQGKSSVGAEGGDESSRPVENLNSAVLAREGSTRLFDVDDDPSSLEALSTAIDEFVLLMDFANRAGYQQVESSENLVVSHEAGLTATFGLDATAESPVQFVYLTIDLPEAQVVAVPTNGLSVAQSSGSNTLISYAATDFVVGDLSGALGNAASNSTALRGFALQISLLETAPGHFEVIDFSFTSKRQI